MEIFQTIWTTLTTENELLTNILCIIFSFIESFIYTLIISNIAKVNYTKTQQITFILSFSILGLLAMFFIPSPFYTYINLLILPILIFFIFKTTALISIISEVVIYIVSLLVSTPLVLLYTYVFNISSYDITYIPIHKFLYSVLSNILILLFILICKKKNFSLPLDKLKNPFSSKILTINFIVGIIAIAIQFYLEFIYIDYLPIHIIVLSISILIIYFLINLFSLYRTSKLEITTQDLEAEKLYNHTLTLLYDEIRGFKHNFNNTVQGIGGYIATNNMEGLKEYYNEVLEECQLANNLSILSPEIINHPAVYSLLTSKYHEATGFGIKVTLEIFMDLTTINMKIYDFTKVLGILIDNAIEASKQCEEKEIIITFRNDNKRNKQLFIIENTYANKNVNIDEIFEKGKTSKTNEDAKNHGLGLWEVKQVVKKNKNLDLYTTKNNKYFKQQFEIYS